MSRRKNLFLKKNGGVDPAAFQGALVEDIATKENNPEKFHFYRKLTFWTEH